MKKILFLFVTLIMSVMGAKAGVVAPATSFTGYSGAPVDGSWAPNTQWFMIQNLHTNGVTKFYLTPSGNYLPQTLPTAANIDDYLWALVGDAENGFQLYNKAKGTNAILWANGSTRGMSAEPTNSHVWDLYTSLAAGKYLFIEHGTEHNAFNNGGQEGRLVTWNSDGALYGWNHTALNPTETGDDGSNFIISGAEDFTVVVNGLVGEGGVVIAGENHSAGTVNTFTVLAEAATPIPVDGYDVSLSLDGNTINVNYTEHVSKFPEAGTYFLTFTGQASGRKNNIYNDLTQAGNYTLQASTQPSPVTEHNNFIWKAVCDGSKMTVVNGQGSTMKVKNGHDAVNGATFNTLAYQSHLFSGNTRYYLMPQDVTLGGGHNCLNVAGNGNYQNASGIECLTTWSTTSGPNAGDNHWAVNVVDMTGLNEYTVNITGDAPGAYVSYGAQNAANGGFFLAASIAKAELTAAPVTGYEATITVDGNNINVAYELTAVPATVTYRYLYKGELWKSETSEQFVGDPVEAPAPIAFANLDYDHELVVANGGTTVDITVTDNLPFDAAADYASITKWYNVRLHSNQTHYMYVDGDAVKFTNEAAGNAYAWAFVGNLKDGFKMVNFVAGETKAMNNATPCAMSEGGYAFLIAATTESVTGGFCLMDGTQCLNYQGDAIKRWGDHDAGSTFRVTEIATPTPGKDWAAFETKLTKLQQYNFGEGLGQYAEVDLSDYDFNSVGEALYYFGVDNTNGDEASYDEDMEVMDKILANLHLNTPKHGQLIRIKTSGNWIATPTYLAGETTSVETKTDRLAFVQPESYDPWAEDNTVWVYYDKGSDGQYLVNYANGLTAANRSNFMGIGMYPSTTRVEFLPANNGAVGKYNIRFAGGRYLYTNNSLYTDAGSTAPASGYEGYNFELEDATTYFQLSYSDKGWATGYFPIDVAANHEYGIDAAYVINTDPEEGYFKADEINGCIPAFTPVVLKVRTDESFRPFVKGAPDSNSTPLPSVLSGALWKQATPANSYVFNVLDGEPGFYKYTGETLGHMKAYYVATTPAASALRINFGDDTLTGIMEAIEKEQFSGAIYDLQGRRINGVQNGVFVKNGKKVVK